MSTYVDTLGRSTLGIGLCGRCGRKFSLDDLVEDPNLPGLRVCQEDKDRYDPYRLAPLLIDPVAMSFIRPDEPVGTNPSGLIDESGDEFFISEDGTVYYTP